MNWPGFEPPPEVTNCPPELQVMAPILETELYLPHIREPFEALRKPAILGVIGGCEVQIVAGGAYLGVLFSTDSNSGIAFGGIAWVDQPQLRVIAYSGDIAELQHCWEAFQLEVDAAPDKWALFQDNPNYL